MEQVVQTSSSESLNGCTSAVAPIEAVRASDVSAVWGMILMTVGLVWGSLLCIEWAAAQLHAQVTHRADYLLMEQSVTGLPSWVTTTFSKQIYQPQPASQFPIRIQIPKLALNSTIVSVQPISVSTRSGDTYWQWQVPSDGVGHHNRSANPGGRDNIVLTGHNNIEGEVFRNLHDVEVGDEITLFTMDQEYYYRVTKTELVRYRRNPEAGEQEMQRFLAATGHEQLTIYSCYPYATSADRIVVIAKPVRGEKDETRHERQQ